MSLFDPVLKYATSLGERSHNLVATLSFAIPANSGRKRRACPTANLCVAVFYSGKQGAAVSGGSLRHLSLRDLKVYR
jgi:hypothetical protein